MRQALIALFVTVSLALLALGHPHPPHAHARRAKYRMTTTNRMMRRIPTIPPDTTTSPSTPTTTTTLPAETTTTTSATVPAPPPAQPDPAPAADTGGVPAVWECIHEHEQPNWNMHGSSYSGGLGQLNGAWTDYRNAGHLELPLNEGDAAVSDQVASAIWLLDRAGARAWSTAGLCGLG